MTKTPDRGVVMPLQESRGIKHKVNSKYVHQEQGIPDDPVTIGALEQWADAWGYYTWEWKIQNQPEPDQEDDKLKALGDTLDKTGKALEKLLPGVKFLDGLATWKGGHLQLTT